MLKRVFVWGSVTAGVVAAIMMYRRGESVGSIVKKAGLHPVGSLVNELKGQRA